MAVAIRTLPPYLARSRVLLSNTYRSVGSALSSHSPKNLLQPHSSTEHTRCQHQTSHSTTGSKMDLAEVTKKLNSFAPTSLAESWDNVGLLVEPSSPHTVSSMLLTNDLTEDVMKEAIQLKTNMILSYHPPIFSGLKRLTQGSWKERIIVTCLENRIAVYSPHTCYDAVMGGVNDWLISPFEGQVKVLSPSTSKDYATEGGFQLQITEPPSLKGLVETELSSNSGISFQERREAVGGTRFHATCTKTGLCQAVKVLDRFPDARATLEIVQFAKPPIPNHGSGRICSLSSPVSIQQAVDMVKKHLKLSHVRLATAVGAQQASQVQSVAVCAGSGASVLRSVKADLCVTGEMSHHDVLDANHKGTSVLLCDHSNTERGFLQVLKEKLNDIFQNSVTLHISEKDHDPLSVV